MLGRSCNTEHSKTLSKRFFPTQARLSSIFQVANLSKATSRDVLVVTGEFRVNAALGNVTRSFGVEIKQAGPLSFYVVVRPASSLTEHLGVDVEHA